MVNKQQMSKPENVIMQSPLYFDDCYWADITQLYWTNKGLYIELQVVFVVHKSFMLKSNVYDCDPTARFSCVATEGLDGAHIAFYGVVTHYYPF